MTENYYLTQKLLPLYFKHAKNRNFFYNVIGHNPENLKVFFEQELYGWVKEDFYKSTNPNTPVPKSELVWKFEHIQTFLNVSDNKKWATIFVNFPVDFVSKHRDSLCLAIAMKGKPQENLEIRLFFLEVGETSLKKEKCIYLCEHIFNDDTHLNHGCVDFNEKFMLNFREKLQDILTTK